MSEQRTIGQLLSWGKSSLEEAGIEDHVVSAEQLLEAVLNVQRVDLFINAGRAVSDHNADGYRRLIERRVLHVPLQHLIGFVEFHNVRLKCDRRALIPRPETEILVETVIERLCHREGARILDVGTGSGNIAVALAKVLPKAKIVALDISVKALQLAQEDIELNTLQDRIDLIWGDIESHDLAPRLGIFDCIVSNPPYITSAERSALPPEVSVYDPPIALFCGDDPLRFYSAIARSAPQLLRPGGLIAVEVGFDRHQTVAELMSTICGDVKVERDLTGIERVVSGCFGG